MKFYKKGYIILSKINKRVIKMNELKNFIGEISKKCNATISVFDKKGNFLLGDQTMRFPQKDVKAVYRENDNTFFEFNFLGNSYVGGINGIGDVSDGYAYLITELASRYITEIAPASKNEFYKNLIDGKISYLSAVKHADKFKIKDKKCTTLLIVQKKGSSKEVAPIVSNYVETANDCVFRYDDKRTVLIKFLSDNNKEYRSIIEYAEILSQTIYEETGIKVKIAIGGTAKRITDLEKSFLQALSVFSMEETITSRGNVRSFREFVIVKALDELPTQKKEEYLNLLYNDCNKDVFSDEVLCTTAEEFFESNLNVSMASRKTFLHRNTLTYRLDKIQRETGLDLRRYNDAVTFRLISILNKLLGE